VASFAAIAGQARGADVASVAYFETDGPRGIRSGDREYPVARAITAIGSLRGAELLVADCALPAGVQVVGGEAHGVSMPPYRVVELDGDDGDRDDAAR
jgi:hypothetical protein